MNVLILGSGGREHALAWSISKSPKLKELFVAPGNAGTAELAINLELDLKNFTAIEEAVLDNAIDMVVVGPEDPLVNGIVDYFHKEASLSGVHIIGPSAAGSQLEGSKEFAKEFMAKFDIPTAAYKSFTVNNIKEGFDFIDQLTPPFVLKADGLAAGKGVLILDNAEMAKIELRRMLEDKKFGDASEKVVIEEFLDGIEMSVFALTDGQSYKILPNAKDYKRIGEGDSGLNTGGMGAVSPVPFADESFMKKVEEKIVKPTVNGIWEEGMTYKGFLFFGLMVVNNEPYVIEYNVRMGDPETEVVLPRIKSDLLDLLHSTVTGKLGYATLQIDERAACTVMMVSGGYPESYEKGMKITGLEDNPESLIFHAGTKNVEGEILTNGGRVLAVTSFGMDFKEALKTSYNRIKSIDFKRSYYRKDIGFDL